MQEWTCENFSDLPQMTFKTDSRFQKQLFVLNGILPAALMLWMGGLIGRRRLGADPEAEPDAAQPQSA